MRKNDEEFKNLADEIIISIKGENFKLFNFGGIPKRDL